MGHRTHLQLLQQHPSPHNRHIRRGNNLPNNRRNVRQSRPHGIFTIRSHASRHGSSRSCPRQRNNGNPHQSPCSRRVRTTNTRARRAGCNPSVCTVRFPHRTHRRSHADSPRRYEKTRWQKRQKSLIERVKCLLTEKLK